MALKFYPMAQNNLFHSFGCLLVIITDKQPDSVKSHAHPSDASVLVSIQQYSRTCLGRPLVWTTTRLGRPQSPARIVSNNKVPGVSDHLPDATESFGLTNDSFTCYERPDIGARGNSRQ